MAQFDTPPFVLTLSYAAPYMHRHRHTVGLEGLKQGEVGALQQCVPIRQGHLKWIGMTGWGGGGVGEVGRQFPQDENREQLMKK